MPKSRDLSIASSTPVWLQDEPEILWILGWFLDRLDEKPAQQRHRSLGLKLVAKSLPNLFRNDSSSDTTWSLLHSLEPELFNITLDRKRSPYDPEFTKARLSLLEGAESQLREWLQRPVEKPYRLQWLEAIEKHTQHFSDSGTALAERVITVPGKSAVQVVDAFSRLSDFSDQRVTLRQLSAKVFWGHSKLLDSREDLILKLFPELRIEPRRILLHVGLPEQCQGILFVENQDSYLQALSGGLAGTEAAGLVYSAGFKGSAGRIRIVGAVSLHYHNTSSEELVSQFEQWWFHGTDLGLPIWFWGDLDFSGMQILKSLRDRFGDVRAWEPGYRSLLQYLTEGDGHVPELADKTEQKDPGNTGCSFTDSELLPALRLYRRFVDQEALF